MTLVLKIFFFLFCAGFSLREKIKSTELERNLSKDKVPIYFETHEHLGSCLPGCGCAQEQRAAQNE